MALMDAAAIKQAVHAALNERDGLDHDTHRAHHDYINQRIERDKRRDLRRQELVDKIKATLIGGLLLLIVGGAMTALYNVGVFVIELYQKSKVH